MVRGGYFMKMVQFESISKNFGKVIALDKINLELDEGEVLGFIGPNGAGKTTSLRILMGIIQASQGIARVFGKDVWHDAVEVHKRISFVPGDVNLWPNLTGGEVIDLFVRLKKSSNKRYLDELVERFELDPSKKCRTYSKGNRQKVALVSAFASDADLYVLDEPTSGLDPLMENVFRECVSEVKKQGKSVLLSSHILSEVEQLCDKVSIIRQGKIIETGTLAEMRHLTRTNVTVNTEKAIENFDKRTDVFNLVYTQTGVSFSTDTDKLGDIISEINKFKILSLECMPPTLEQLFMSHYSQ